MNDPEGFLSRWSRRKREAENAAPESALPEESAGAATPESQPGEGEENRAERSERSARKDEAPPEPAFDLSKLPPIESITADTDIRGFLAPGVPPELTRAALRRVWVVDPKIRDFIEIAENQWDFTAPGVPGFDLSPPTGDIARMIADILPRGAREESAPAEKVEAKISSAGTNDSHPELIAQTAEAPTPSAVPEPKTPEFSESEKGGAVTTSANDPAPQQDAAPQEGGPRRRRGHGGAMPA